MDCISIFFSCEKPETVWELIQKIFVNAVFWGCNGVCLCLCISFIYVNFQTESTTDYVGLNIVAEDSKIPPTFVIIESRNIDTETSTRSHSNQIFDSTNVDAKRNPNTADMSESFVFEEVNSKNLETPNLMNTSKSSAIRSTFE